MTGYAAVLLAAGQAARYREAGGTEATKLLARFRGQPLVRHAAAAALASCATPVLLVTGHAAEAVAAALADLPLRVVHNPRFAIGLAVSLKAGIEAVPPSCAGAVVLLADMPDVAAATIDALVAHAQDCPAADAVVPVQGGRRGNPVLLRRSLFAAVGALQGDAGARHLLRDAAWHVAELTLPGSAALRDVDRPEDLA